MPPTLGRKRFDCAHLLERGGRAGVCAPLGFTDLFTAPRNAPDSDIAGCELMETPMGTQIRTAETRRRVSPACSHVATLPKCRIRYHLPSVMAHGPGRRCTSRS